MSRSFHYGVLLTAISQPVASAVNVELTAEPLWVIGAVGTKSRDR
jgi:hypothetical protein